jgi:hypothetical protein
MDVLLDSRNGLDSGYFSLLGVGEGRKRVGKWRNAQAQELANNNPYINDADGQSRLIAKHEAVLENIKEERARAKSKKTKNSLDARIQAYNEWLADAKYYLTELEKQALASEPTSDLSTLTSGGKTYDVSPAPIVTSQGGQIELPKKQVFVEETMARQGDVANEGLVQPTQPQAKGGNSLLYIGIGVGVLALFLILRKK